MNKQTITFTASEQTLTKTGGIEHYASNIVSYIEASFTLGDNWAGYDSIRAVWESGYARIATVLDANNKCIVPAEVLTYKSKVNVNLVGSIVENTVLTDRLTTYPILALTVDADARVDSSETTPVTATQFEQFVDVVRDEASAIQNYTYDSEAWAVGQRAGVDVPSTDETYQNNAKYYADQGATLQQEVSDLKSDINQLNVSELAISQGYWAIVDGTPTASTTWCRTDSYIPKNFRLTSDIRMFLLAYLNGVYIGTWNGTEFSKTYAPDAHMEDIDIAKWSKNYPTYQFKIDFSGDGSAITPTDCQNALSIVTTEERIEKKISNVSMPLFANAIAVEQGYWGIANGEAADNFAWCRSVSFVPQDFIFETSQYKMALLAYNTKTGEYIGTWNGTEFVRVYDQVTIFSKSIVIPYFVKKYGYVFKLNFFNNGNALSPSDVLNDLSVSSIEDSVECQNLIGNDFNALYPVDGIAEGVQLTISTSDGELSGKETRIYFYDENKNELTWYGFGPQFASRTITINTLASSAKYIAFGNNAPRVPLMINFGSSALPYEEYYWSMPKLTNSVMDIENGSSNISVIHRKSTEELYALKRHYGENSADNSFKALWVSDIHNEQDRMSRMVDYLNSCGSSYFDIAINTGDTVLTVFSQDIDWYDDLVDESNIPILNTVGNHDAWLNLNGELANKVDVYNKFIAPVADHTSIVQPTGASTDGLNYYYKDVGDVRLIVLDCMYYDSAEQTWFESVLEDAHANSLPVIACSHAPFESQYCQLLDSIWNVGWFHRDSTKTNIAMAQAVKEFEDNGGTFICWLMGHIHGDEVEILPNYNNQLALCTNTFQDRGTTVVKNTDDRAYNYDSLTFVTVDSVNHTVKMYRIGANIDTAGHRHNGFVWDYVNRQLVTEW